ncbi:acyltransferase [Pseudobutyrivibrio ruminis]|uniref:Surface polysaccharide O-acyltransferase, integral membrane enzyme n=1 Tax=Pseudobutyrivibrio ruminis DSM 9787 TaxID=1123011 RepID=A0A285S9K0_9FIRM|nr:acyltransferase family protein [Pseudobutyrivibrio ruminis]SOC03945.1 Surface polysaccharide O-acyltransferase, integral membrane enzyme [Pseudobutyrivibrio ruminis DSM 9787]
MERKTYCDYLRFIATLAVVVLHVSASNWYGSDVNGMQWQIFNFYDSVVRWGVPIFVMISGSLFLNKELSLEKIYGTYILRMVIAYITWSILYALMTKEVFEKGIVYGIKANIGAVVSGHYHMWFMIMIIGLYMCIPFYRKLIKDGFVLRYFLVLSFIFSMMIPWSMKLINDYVVGDNELLTKLVSVVNSDIDTLGMHMVLGYAFYFVLGYYLDSIELEKKHRIIIYIMGVIGFAFTIIVDANIAIKTQQPCSNYYGNFNVNILSEAICIHTLFKYHQYNNSKLNYLFFNLSKYMFGIFLVHAFFIELFSNVFNFSTSSFNALFSVPVVSMVVIICALTVSVVLNHIPIIKKYCV